MIYPTWRTADPPAHPWTLPAGLELCTARSRLPWALLEIYSGEAKVLRVLSDGTIDIGHLTNGRKVGSR